MQVRSENYRLLVRFCQSEWLKAHGIRAQRTLTGPVTLVKNGRTFGTWWYERDIGYCLGRQAHSDPLRKASTPEEAVAITIAMATRASQTRSTRPLA